MLQVEEMKNKDLIAILSQQDPETEVFLEYDTLCCVFKDFSIVKVNDKTQHAYEWRNKTGIWIMCEDENMAHYLWSDKRSDHDIEYEILHGGIR
jgi:hypothetical protein